MEFITKHKVKVLLMGACADQEGVLVTGSRMDGAARSTLSVTKVRGNA